MQAQLEARRVPSTLVMFVLALVMALTLGAALGYALKPATLLPGSIHTVVVPNQSTGANSQCEFIDKHKAC